MTAPAELPIISPAVQFDADLIRRYSRQGPRYTSYPTADRFTPGFGMADYLQAAARVRQARAGQAAVALPAHPVLRIAVLLLRLQQDHHARP